MKEMDDVCMCGDGGSDGHYPVCFLQRQELCQNNENLYRCFGPTGWVAVWKAVQNGPSLREEINAAGGLKRFEFVMMDDSNDDTRVNNNYLRCMKGMQMSLGCNDEAMFSLQTACRGG
ncbi:MAG: hypothetical protein ACLRSW_12195 [Christensenellaceae bacterium]